MESKLVDKLILFTAGIILDKDGIDGINLDLSDAISLDDYDRYSLDKSTINETMLLIFGILRINFFNLI